MAETTHNESEVREYLLGRVSDEAALEGLEERLFTDEEFCTLVALVEDGLVNDYVLGRLDARDAESFRSTLASDPERRLKLELTEALRERALQARPAAEPAPEKKPSFFAALAAALRRPAYAAALAVLLVAALAAFFYLRRGPATPDELAELRSVYARARPTEARLSSFDYAPRSELRGAPDAREAARLRRIENTLIEATEKTPGADTHHALGVFYLTQGKHAEAVRELDAALRLDPRRARAHNDLGAAHFELARVSPAERRLAELARALEEFDAAAGLDANLLEALFNKSLALQTLGMTREARESWALYLQKDSTSQWAEEARRNAARLSEEQTRFKSDAEVLEDFLAAYRAGDDERARRIHHETKGLLRGPAVPLQLARRCLAARRRGDEREAAESVAAMTYVGRFERDGADDFFFLRWPTSTRAPGLS